MSPLTKLDKAIEKKGELAVTVWQFAKFALASLVAMAAEFSLLIIMNHIDALTALNSRPVDWFVFHYEGNGVEGLGTMIAFLVSTTVAQIITYVINRKKTFGSNTNLTFSVVFYTLVIIALICAQAFYAPHISAWLQTEHSFNPDGAMSLAKACFSFINFVILFPLEKFVIMRKVEKK